MTYSKEKNCLKCGQPYTQPKDQRGGLWGRRKYCSVRCSGLSRIGVPCGVGRVSPMKGKKHMEIAKQKNRIAHLGQVAWNKGMKGLWLSRHFDVLNNVQKGENHPRWKGGTKSRDKQSLHNPPYREWRMSVYKRDGFKCRIANKECSGQLEAHHILRWSSYPELRYELNNGITLCLAHHPRKRSEEAKLSPYFQQLVAEMN